MPLDYSKPKGRQITLTVSGAGSLSAKHFMLMNPGGPGASGIVNTQLVYSGLPEAVREQYAVFSFDPRGAGLSTPITCGNVSKIVTHPALPYRPGTPARSGDEQFRPSRSPRAAESTPGNSCRT